jgi:hypothetical protein
MTLTSTRQFARLGVAAALALLLASPSAARDISIPFNADNFDDPLDIDNPYWPLVSGTTFIYKVETPDGCEEDHFVVTNHTKKILGITTRVVHDTAYEDPNCDGTLIKVEETDDWHAQDNAGNIWYFGEETFDCTPDGQCTLGPGSWEAGKDIQNIGSVAEPGIIVLAAPKKGDTYYQEFYEGFAEDQATVKGLGTTVTLQRDDAYPPGTFNNCMVTKEFTALSTGAVEQKSYCRGTGLVLVEEHSGKVVRFELIDPDFIAETNDAFRFRKPPR